MTWPLKRRVQYPATNKMFVVENCNFLFLGTLEIVERVTCLIKIRSKFYEMSRIIHRLEYTPSICFTMCFKLSSLQTK